MSEVSRYLGYSSIVVTLNVYTHGHGLPDWHYSARAKLATLYDGIEPRAEGDTGVKQLAATGSA